MPDPNLRLASDLRRRAEQILPRDVMAYYAAGAGAELTLNQQDKAWNDVWLRPRVLADVTDVSTAVDLLGSRVASPVVIAPTALHGLAHDEGEVATARGGRAAESLYVVSMRASRRIDDIGPSAGTFWQQIYMLHDRGVSDEAARRATDLGARALVLTLDTPLVAWKPATIPRPAMAAAGLIPALSERDPLDERLHQTSVTARDIGRLHDMTGLPIVAKGVLRGDQARACVDAGAAAVVVSTHGGRQLDGVIPVPYALREVAEAVAGRAEVYADGGVRTGVDVVRALGLGARAVMVGRPVLWALAVGGAEGVAKYLNSMRAEVREALALAGCVGPSDVGADIAVLTSRQHDQPDRR